MKIVIPRTLATKKKLHLCLSALNAVHVLARNVNLVTISESWFKVRNCSELLVKQNNKHSESLKIHCLEVQQAGKNV